MSLYDLPPELIATVVSFLVFPKIRLAPYASISTTWQQAIERRTFSSLHITSDDLEYFETLVVHSHTHRRIALRIVQFTVILPTYDDKACARYEKERDRQVNNEAFGGAVARLFRALHTCENVDRPTPIALTFRDDLYSPMDPNHRGSEKHTADRRAWELGQRDDLWEHRYEHSYLRLPYPETLPVLTRITSLSVISSMSRYIDPTVAAAIFAKLPKLDIMTWSLCDSGKRFESLRSCLRQDFGQSLQNLQCASLRTLKLKYWYESPCNEGFVNADVRGMKSMAGDSLSAALRQFIQTHALMKVTLDGPISLDSGFFWTADQAENQQIWPHLEVLSLSFSKVRPDGGWYFERDPISFLEDSNGDDSDDFNSIHDEDSEAESEYDSDESFFVQDEEPPDTYDWRKEERLTGGKPIREFRTQPNAQLELFLEAAARSVACMPKLKTLAAGADIQPCQRTEYQPREFMFEYAAKGVALTYQGVEDIERPRLYWTAPKGWKMSEQLDELWRCIIGQDGIVEYEEW